MLCVVAYHQPLIIHVHVTRACGPCLQLIIQPWNIIISNLIFVYMSIGHSNAVTSVAFSPDGSKIVSGSGDKNVCIWDAATGAREQTLTGISFHDVCSECACRVH